MSDKLGLDDAAQILHHLLREDEGKHRRVAGAELDSQMALLRRWQSERLAATHADLLADPRYAPAGRFFLSDIYAPRDFSQRDHDAERMYDFMSKFLPARALRVLALVVELNSLSNLLDESLLRALVDRLAVADTITEELYAEAYRICDNYAERVHQIELVVEVGRSVERIVQTPLAGMTLRLARAPAQRAGWFELQDFLERGYAAFKHMEDAETFLGIIQAREMRVLNQIFAGTANPFDIS